jgi:trk system potassium uptake protein TrkH
MRPHVVLRYVGFVSLLISAFLFVSAGISLLGGDSAFLTLLYSGVVCALFGVFPLIFVPRADVISNKEGFIIVVSGWLIACLAGAMPYILWGGEFSLANAWFESVSGFTTTGSSILADVEGLPSGLLFWRASTHWIGGTGIIILMLTVLPYMGRAGMVLYRAEASSLASENFHYRTRKTLQILLVVYVGLTVLETVSLVSCGMGLFDAVTHAFATIATGGLSTKNASIAHFKSVPVEVVVMGFMLLSGIHFGLLFQAAQGRVQSLWRSTVVKYYLLAVAAGILLVAWNVKGSPLQTWAEALRYAAFQVISVGTSTGFATADSTLWPPFSQLILIFFTLQGAGAGSTSGGIKVDRVVIFWKALFRRIRITQHPRAVIAVKVDGTPIENEAVEATVLYVSLYLGVVLVSALILTGLGMDILSAFSGSAAAMGNVGPGFGAVGSMANFGGVPETGKWVLSLLMLLGRLEIFAIIIFLWPGSWK